MVRSGHSKRSNVCYPRLAWVLASRPVAGCTRAGSRSTARSSKIPITGSISTATSSCSTTRRWSSGPTGYLTTYKDPEGRPTVYDLIGEVGTFVSPVGRLDYDTSGLLLLTNDSRLSERVTNPASHVPKTYLVKASTRLSDAQLDQLRNGVMLDDGHTRPAVVARLRDSEKYTHFEITLTEGRNRQVRRMVEAIGSHVLKLVRVKIGDLAIGSLPIGRWREVSPEEVAQLLRFDGDHRFH
jgi:pseudouridine synthase